MNSFEAKNNYDAYLGIEKNLQSTLESIEELKAYAAEAPMRTARVMAQQSYREARDTFPGADQLLFKPHLENLNLLEKNPDVLKNVLDLFEIVL